MAIRDWFRHRDQDTQTEITPPISNALLEALLAGETITREKALTLPAVAGAVDFIANAIACMPVRLHKIRGDGRVSVIENDPRVALLNNDTHDTLDAFQMKHAVVADYLLGKGGWIFINRDGNDFKSLNYVDERYVCVEKYYHPIFKRYKIFVAGYADGSFGELGYYEPWDFVKLLRDTKDGATGRGVVDEVSTALETAYETLKYQLGLVKTGGNKRGFIKSQRKLDEASMNALKAAWSRLYANDTEKVVILNDGLEFQEASRSSVEMQLNESKRTLQDEINTIFHIYPDDFERTFKEAIYPVVKAFETALNRDLLLEKEKGKKYFAFDVKEIIKASFKERVEAYKTAKETGYISINEIRRMENMDWIEGLDVVNVGLGAVLFDTNTHTYYTPNTDTVSSPSDAKTEETPEAEAEANKENAMIEGHIEAEEFDASGNSSSI